MRSALVTSPARTRLEDATRRLAAAGVETPRVDAEWLLAAALGVRRSGLHLALEADLDPATAARFEASVERRARREPLQQIVGWEEFWGLRFLVTTDVLVPRPETEMLVERALALLPPPGSAPLVVDVGTGSGCVACAIAHERPDARVVAVEASMAALAVAAGNVRALGLGGRVGLVAGDLLAAVRAGGADLVVSNPPYLPTDLVATLAPEVREHEPVAAIDGGPDGLALVRPLVAGAIRVLRPGGALALETAGGAQAAEVAALLEGAGFSEATIRRDLTGTERIVSGRLTAEGLAPLGG
jgi:release factor glutamine methyltransferase